MEYNNIILSLLIFFPLVGILFLSLSNYLGITSEKGLKVSTFVITLLQFFLSVPLFFKFNSGSTDIQFEHLVKWFPELGISYHLGLDGISILLVLLTTFIFPIAILSAWNVIKKGQKVFLCLMLLLESALIGTFAALDMILFFIFWEAVLIPMYFIIGIWGTSNRIYAAIKFFIYTAFGSALMLIAMMYLYFAHIDQMGFASMAILDLYNVSLPFDGILSPQGMAFLAFFLAFAIKVPMFPFHTWLPDAHVEAPTPGSVILAAVLLKMGAYGFLRFMIPFFPEAFSHYIGILVAICLIGIIYGAMIAFVQKDLKKLVAYSSVSHMGLIMLGIFVFNIQGVQGGIYQMIGHGLSTGALFILVGMIYERRHTKLISEFGGISKVMPIFAILFMISLLSSVGLPLLNGFIGEFLVLLGAFKVNYWYAAIGATGLILGAVYMLWAYQKVMFGPLLKRANKDLLDINAREFALMVPIVIMMVVMGVYPKPFLSKIEPSVKEIIEITNNKGFDLETKTKVVINK